jgi:hypothetical protein
MNLLGSLSADIPRRQGKTFPEHCVEIIHVLETALGRHLLEGYVGVLKQGEACLKPL